MTRRRTFSQIVMWAILAATVGLAAALDRHVENANHIELAPPTVVKHLSFCLPQGWTPLELESHYLVAAVKEPEVPGRALTIFAQRMPGVRSEEQYLQQAGFFDFEIDDGFGEQSISIGDRKGILIRGIYNERALVYLACVMLRNGTYITIRIDGGEESSNSEKLIRLIAQTVHTVADMSPV